MTILVLELHVPQLGPAASDAGLLSALENLVPNSVIEGAKPADWEFVIAGDAMTGTLTLRNDKQLFRRVRAERKKH